METSFKSKYHASSIAKAIRIMKCFTPDQMQLGTTEIARKIGLSKATTHRILNVLDENGVLQKSPVSKKYRIGPELYFLGSLYLITDDILEVAAPVIKKLNDLTNEVVNVAIFEKGYAVIVMREESKHELRWSRHVGSVLPTNSSSMGKALLSELTEAEIDSLYPVEELPQITTKTIRSKTELKKELEQIRQDGISVDNEGTVEGIIGIGTLIRDASGKAVAAISIAAPTVRVNDTKRAIYTSLVKQGASLISYSLGYRNQEKPVKNLREVEYWWEQNKLNEGGDSFQNYK